MAEELLCLIARNPVAVVIDHNFRHSLSEVLEFEIDIDARGFGVKAIPNEFSECLYRLGPCLPGHEVVFDLDLEMFDVGHGDTIRELYRVQKNKNRTG
jgi:hypothetical protein